jgi:hypothetical protein
MKEEQKQGRIWWLTFLGLAMAVWAFFGPAFWATILALIASAGVLVLAIWREWAPENFILSFVNEGEMRVIVRSGGFYRIILRWTGWRLASQEDVEQGNAKRKWDVIPGEEIKSWWRKLLGGLVFVGIPPFQGVLAYPFKWAHLKENGEVERYDEMIDWFFAKQDLYVIEMNDVEDCNALPLKIEFVIPARVVNAWEALFVSHRWLAMVTGLLEPPIRRFVGGHSYADLKAMISGESPLEPLLWEEIGSALGGAETETVVVNNDEEFRIYGAQISKRRAGFSAIDPPASYRQMTTRQYEASQDAEAERIRGTGAGQATAQRVTLAVANIARQLAGFSPEQELNSSQEKEVTEKVSQAYQLWLTDQGLQSVKPTDKVIISGGASGLGREVSGLTIQEMVRQAIKEEKEE